MVSMKDIAKECGVSIAAVSKALNDHNDISEETKEYINSTAKRLGYTVNAAAKALKTNKTYNIGVLFAEDSQSGLTHDYFSFVLDSFKKNIEKKGYDLTFINNGKRNGRNAMTYLEHSRYRRFDGVLIACANFYSSEVMELVIEAEMPIVTLDHIMPGRSSIMSNNTRGMQELIQFIYSKGHRRIAYIYGDDSAVTKDRLTSFYIAMEAFGIKVPEEYIMQIPYRDTKKAHQATDELLDLKKPPTCIIYPDDFASFGGMNAIRERGLSIPGDISIAGYDGIRIGRHIKPELTTLRQDTEALGKAAAEKLVALIERPKTTLIENVVVDGSVYEGGTVKDINQGKKEEA